MMWKTWLVLALTVAGAVSPVAAGLDELAARGDWARVLEVARRRGEQLPLRPEEAFVASVAADALGDHDAQLRFLELAARGGPLAEVARVELAERLVAADGERALELVAPQLRRPLNDTIRDAAVAVAGAALETPLPPSARAELERGASTLPRRQRRSLEVKLAITADRHRRQRLGHVLEASARDLEALEAARALLEEEELTAQERWWAAQALYRHAFYGEAQRLLDGLGEPASRSSLPAWRIDFLAGRCAFRQGDFAAAANSYRSAITHAGGGERAADLQVHLARALELDGRLEEAVTAAQGAVRLRPTDERRLFLARLRLRSGRPDYARLGIGRIRSRSARDRGRLLLALAELARGERAAAGRSLAQIDRQPWSGPAAVLAAEVAGANGDWTGAVDLLDGVGWSLSPFWAEQARALLEQAPTAVVEGWRRGVRAEAATGSERARRRTIAGWAALEVDGDGLSQVRARIAAESDWVAAPGSPEFAPGLAAELWRLGLPGRAVRWDPSGLPHGDAASALWSAQHMLEHDAAGAAIVTADAAWRMAGAQIPVRGYKEDLERALYPLPYPAAVRRAASEHGVPWSLLAALAREESRWSPTAVSAVGARGLLQLLPETASTVAKRLGRPAPTADDLFDPEVSLDLGAAEVAQLLRSFDGRWAPAVAAYNAGQPQATLWLSECGRDCTPGRYVATISFAATRAYTSQVLAGASIYDHLYGAPGAVRRDR